ncbi:LysR family transcriptional regulator, partial [Haematobacter genomosp. 1]|uniref:LysR family transcriptional regulator n=1 Tax=Haematobacter genomosp. 1 TaxID=366618 RepID=UPI001C52EE9F
MACLSGAPAQLHNFERTCMDIRLLESFVMVVRNGSSTAAARILGVTQPAVSGQIARLERSLGFDLFSRQSGGLVLTPNGKLFLSEAENVLRACN